MLTHVTINSTLRDILVKYRTIQRLVENNRTQTMVIHSGYLYTTVIIHKSDGTQTSAVFQVTHHNGHAIISRSTSRDIGYVNLPAIKCPPLSMAPITHDVQTLQQHVEQPRMHKTQSSITIDNIRNKGTNNSVADVLSHASPHPHRSTQGLGVEMDYIHFFQKMSYVHFPSVKQPYFACTKPLHPISS